MAREVDAAAGRFEEGMRALAHDLKNPLAAISANIDYLRKLGVEREVLDDMAQSCATLNAVLTDLLDTYRLEDGRLKPACATVPARAAVESAIAPLRASLAPRRLDVAIDVPAGVEVVCDAALFARVLAALVEISARSAPAGSRIRIGWRDGGLTYADEGGRILSDGADVGERFPPKESFCRVARPLALPFAVRAMAAMGGQLSVEESGASQVIRLPLPAGSAP